jgi:hypothetical protein
LAVPFWLERWRALKSSFKSPGSIAYLLAVKVKAITGRKVALLEFPTSSG